MVTRPLSEIAQEVKAVKAANANPAAALDRASKAIGGDLQTQAPKHAAALGGVMGRAISFLASKAPQGRTSATIPGISKPETRFSDAELHNYERASQMIRDMPKVIENAKHGSISREGIEALELVYPKIYEQMRGQMLDELGDMEKRGELGEVDYPQRVLLGTLLKIPADETLQPGFIARLQALKQATPDKPKPGQGPEKLGTRRPLKLDVSAYQTQAETIEAST
jgi:hypothetical protein